MQTTILTTTAPATRGATTDTARGATTDAMTAAALAEYVAASDPWYRCHVRVVAPGGGVLPPIYGVVLTHQGTGLDVPPLFQVADYARHMSALPWLYPAEERAAFAAWGQLMAPSPVARPREM